MTVTPLTTQEQDTIKDALVLHLRDWLSNSLPAPFTGISKGDAIIVTSLAAQKLESDIRAELLTEQI